MSKRLVYRLVTAILGIVMVIYSTGLWVYDYMVHNIINLNLAYPAILFPGLMMILLSLRKDVWNQWPN